VSGGIVVAVSGTGSNLRALHAAAIRGELGADIFLVVADRACAALDWAAEEGIETALVPGGDDATLAATLAAYAGALLSKEHVAFLPVWCALLVIVEWPRRPWRWAAAGLAGMTGVLVAFLLLRSVAMTRVGPGEHLFDLYNPAAGLPLLERWLTGFGVIWRYATLFFWPASLSIAS